MRRKTAFTLVEILIVVVILGILAAIVLPKFSNASATARASMLADNLHVIRTQISVFQSQHIGVPPGYPDCDTSQAPTEAAFLDHMTMASNVDGETAAPNTVGYKFGPYFSYFAENPVNGKGTVQIVGGAEAFPAEGDDSHGWIYQPTTMIFKADSSGIDQSGKDFIDY